MMSNHIMLDLETLSTASNAAIVSIGATVFNTRDGAVDDKTFYRRIDLESSVEYGHMDVNTICWWMKQSDSARAQTFETGDRCILNHALLEFYDFAITCEAVSVWGNGAAFDNTILRNAFMQMHMPFPTPFWTDMCYRTVKNLHPEIQMERTGTHHNALDDAISQAKHLLKIHAETGALDNV